MWNRLSPWWWRGAVVVFLVAVVYLGPKAGPRVNCKELEPSIVQLELAGQAECSLAVLAAWDQAWGEEGRAAVRRALFFDDFFVAAYAGLLFLLCRWGGTVFAAPAPGARLGPWLAWAQVAAGLLDWIENRALCRILDDAPGAVALAGRDTASLAGVAKSGAIDIASRVAAGCAGVKFLLIGIGVAYILVATVVWLVKPRSR